MLCCVMCYDVLCCAVLCCAVPCDALCLQLVEAFGAGTAAIVSPVSAIGYGGRDLHIPVGEESAKLVGRPCGSSVAELVRDKILDIQVRGGGRRGLQDET
jgi:hypothetical protein